MPNNVIIVIGISGVTTIISKVIIFRPRFYKLEPYESFKLPPVSTMFMQNGKIRLSRIQFFITTIIGNIIYLMTLIGIITTVHNFGQLSTPDIGTWFIVIIGISHVIYLMDKLRAKSEPNSIKQVATTKKVEEKFQIALEDPFKRSTSKMSQITEFLDWFKEETGENVNWLLSRISDKFITELLETMKSYYSNILIKEIANETLKIIENQNSNKTPNYVIHSLTFKIKPIEFYLELSNKSETEKETIVRLTLRIDSDIYIKKLKAVPALIGIKIYSENVATDLKLSLTGISIIKPSINYMHKPTDLQLDLRKKDFKMNDLFISSAYSNANIWLEDVSNLVHNPVQPLIKNKEYVLKIAIYRKYFDKFFSSTRSTSEYDKSELRVIVASSNFEVSEKTQTIFLAKEGNPEAVTFRVTPSCLGEHKLNIFFYKGVDLLQILSVPLKVESSKNIEFKPFVIRLKEPYTLPVEVLSCILIW